MNNLIYTVHFDIPKEDLDTDDIEKNIFTKKQLEKYKDKLAINKFRYSVEIDNCDFICFDDLVDLNLFSKKFKSDIPKYTIINFYKLHLLDILAEEYDNILYLDQDVYINTSKNMFKELDMSNISIWHENMKDKFLEYMNFYNERELYSRSYLNKCVSSYVTSFTFDWPINYNKYNTGVILSNKHNIKKLNIKNNLNFLVDNYNNILYNKDIPSSISSKFILNNEAFLANIISKEQIKVNNLDERWHHILNHSSVEQDFKESNSHFYHLINKKFDWLPF